MSLSRFEDMEASAVDGSNVRASADNLGASSLWNFEFHVEGGVTRTNSGMISLTSLSFKAF